MNDQEFRFKEYDTAVNDRAEIIREINKIEKGALILDGLIFSWLLTNTVGPNNELYLIAWFIPLLITLLSGYRVLALNKVLESREKYLRKLEKILIEETPKGLFTTYHRRDKPEEKGKSNKSAIGRSSIYFWYILIVICGIIPVVKSLSIVFKLI